MSSHFLSRQLTSLQGLPFPENLGKSIWGHSQPSDTCESGQRGQGLLTTSQPRFLSCWTTEQLHLRSRFRCGTGLPLTRPGAGLPMDRAGGWVPREQSRGLGFPWTEPGAGIPVDRAGGWAPSGQSQGLGSHGKSRGLGPL